MGAYKKRDKKRFLEKRDNVENIEEEKVKGNLYAILIKSSLCTQITRLVETSPK